jgi:hypothetical protein
MPPRREARTNREDVSGSHPVESAADNEDQQNEDRGSASGDFLFISNTGQKGKASDPRQMKSLRAHVMRNYLARDPEGRQQGQQQGSGAEVAAGQAVLSTREQPRQIKPAVRGGQRMRFRLKSDGLELRYPHQHSKGKKKDGRVQDAATVAAERSKRSATVQGMSNDADSPTRYYVPGYPLTLLHSPASIDPFGTLAVRLDSRDEVFLSRFYKLDRYPWCPINGQSSSWSMFALSDQLVFHATMFSWGMHFRHRMARPDSDEEMQVIQHKVAAISLINDRLSDPEQAVSDATIAAVAALTNIALVVDSFPEATQHMQGLQAIVDMRGGLGALTSGVQQHLQRLITWNDLIYSEVFDEKLRFPAIDIWDRSWVAFPHPDFESDLPGLSAAELRAAGVPRRHEVLDILRDVWVLCYAEQVSPLARTAEAGRMQRGDMFHRVERRLRLIVQAEAAPGRNSRWDATVWRAVSLAALIFTHHHLRGNPLKYRHFPVLTTQLYDTLLTMSEDLSEFDFAPAMLVWMLSAGVVASPIPAVRESLLVMLADACRRHGLVDWEGYWSTLSGFLQAGDADEKRHLKLWPELDGLVRASASRGSA